MPRVRLGSTTSATQRPDLRLIATGRPATHTRAVRIDTSRAGRLNHAAALVNGGAARRSDGIRQPRGKLVLQAQV